MPDLTEEHEAIDGTDIDPGLVNRTLEKINEPRESNYDVAKDLAEILQIDETHAETLVESWREPDWPIEYTREIRTDSVDVYNTFELHHRGYEPAGLAEELYVDITWEIDQYQNSIYGTSEYDVSVVSINGRDIRGE